MKTRNHVILALIRANRRTTVHGKTFKAKRRFEKISILKEAE